LAQISFSVGYRRRKSTSYAFPWRRSRPQKLICAIGPAIGAIGLPICATSLPLGATDNSNLSAIAIGQRGIFLPGSQ